jgi:hypothetical protein
MNTKFDLPLMSAVFVVTGMDFNPNECTTHFDLEPSEVRIKGESQPKTKRLAPQSSWSVVSKWQRMDSTDHALQLVTDKIWPKRKQIREFIKEKELRATFTLNITGAGKRNFMYEFSPQTLERLAYFRAPLYLDVY